MNGGRGPDVLGLCEVENRHVLEQLATALAPAGRRYGIAHADTGDERGIDVAFLHDTAVFEVNPAEVFSHYIVKRTANRAGTAARAARANSTRPGSTTLFPVVTVLQAV